MPSAPWRAEILAVVVASACYSPTEATLSLDTDIACAGDGAAPKDTMHDVAIYVGDRPDPVATTTACRRGQIGTFVVTPDGARDGHVSVEVVVALGESHAEQCRGRIDDATCVVAKSGFSFAEHASTLVPIHVYRACAGFPCPSGQTCVGAHSCASAETR